MQFFLAIWVYVFLKMFNYITNLISSFSDKFIQVYLIKYIRRVMRLFTTSYIQKKSFGKGNSLLSNVIDNNYPTPKIFSWGI